MTASASNGFAGDDEEGGEVTCGTWLYTQPQRRGGHSDERPARTNGTRMLRFQQNASSPSSAAAAEGNGLVMSTWVLKK